MNKKIIFLSFSLIAALSACKSTKVETKDDTSSKMVKDKYDKVLSAHDLLKRNQIDDVKAQFQLANDINAIDDDGNTVLHLAAQIDDADLVTFLLLKGADPELKNFESDTPLHVAIKNNSIESAKAISGVASTIFDRNADGVTALDLGLQKDPAYYDIFITTKAGELRDTEGQSIVHYFVKTKNVEGIEHCIKKGIPITVKDNAGKTPLDIAYESINDEYGVLCAAVLILGGAESNNDEYSYFETAVANRNLNERFDDGQTPLHYAAINNHEAIAKYLLENDADSAAQDSSGASPLHEAVRYGNIAIAQDLLNSGADVNAKDNLGKTPIMLIIPGDKLKDVYTLLIGHRVDLNQKDMYGDTVLHNAAMLNVDIDTISLLTNNGADINTRNKEGVTPLAIAVQKKSLNAVRLFASSGANIHTQDTRGVSPLMLALNGSQEMLEAIVNSKNALSQDSEGNTPLHIALLSDAPLSKIQYLISLTDDVNLRNRDGNSALFLAVVRNRQKVGELLLAKNADIFSTNTNNNSPLRLALKYGGSVQNWLVTSKTIKAKDGSGNTALHYAAEWQYNDAISSLLTKGADISARNGNGETPLFNAAKTNNPKIIQTVVDGGADVLCRDYLGSTAVHTAVRWDAPDSVDKLVLLGANINAQNSAGKSPLAEAVVSGKYSIARKLLEAGANANSCDTNGVSVLIDAIRANNKDMIKLLLVHGANPNLQEVNGQNAYHEAAYMGDVEVIALIRSAGGNPLARDKKGNTPFSIVLNKNVNVIREVLGTSYTITDSDGNSPIHIVVKAKKSVALLQTLIDEGYPIDTKNSDGYTALNYAIEQGDLSSAVILLQNGADPFQMIDRKGRNGVTIALERKDSKMLSNIVKYAGEMCDVQGNTILHYAAKSCSEDNVRELVSYGLDKKVQNVAGDTPYMLAIRWKRPENAELLK